MKRIAAVVLTTLLALSLVGCGSSKPSLDSLSASALLKKARGAVAAQKYVSISGKITESGQETDLDLKYAAHASSGKITLGGAVMELEAIGKTTYFRPSASYWQQQLTAKQAKAIISIIGNDWIVADADNANFNQLIALSQRQFITKDVLEPAHKATKGKPTTIAGRSVIPLTIEQGTIYLDSSTALPVEIVGKGSGGTGTAHFGYGAFTPPTAPAKSNTADLAKLLK